MIGKDHWVNRDLLKSFILECQDFEDGGFADRQGDVADVFHTLFGLAALSLLGYPGLKEIDPRYCMTVDVVERFMNGRK